MVLQPPSSLLRRLLHGDREARGEESPPEEDVAWLPSALPLPASFGLAGLSSSASRRRCRRHRRHRRRRQASGPRRSVSDRHPGTRVRLRPASGFGPVRLRTQRPASALRRPDRSRPGRRRLPKESVTTMTLPSSFGSASAGLRRSSAGGSLRRSETCAGTVAGRRAERDLERLRVEVVGDEVPLLSPLRSAC